MKKQLVLMVILLVLIGFVYFVWSRIPKPSEQVFCTQEAMLCPDGSYVGRTGPNCELTACPKSGDLDSWATVVDDAQGITFQYPAVLSTQYIYTQEWPPVVTMHTGDFVCLAPLRSINNRTYCVTSPNEGAAGSVYTDYTYSTALEQKGEFIAVTFTLRAVQCGNYDEPQQVECERERATFDLDGIVGRIVDSVEFN